MNELAEEKKFYDRFWALHADPVLSTVFAKFGPTVFRRSSVLEGFAKFIEEQDFRGRCCVEIGTHKGLTAIVLARHFGEVVSIDVQPDADKHAIAAYCGVENVRFIDVRGNDEKAEVVAGLDFDAAYVDGDHTNDTDADFALVKRCRRVLFHEYWPAQPPVWNLVHRLMRKGNVVTSGKLALWTA